MHKFHNITSTKQHNIIRDPRSKEKKTNKHIKPKCAFKRERMTSPTSTCKEEEKY